MSQDIPRPFGGDELTQAAGALLMEDSSETDAQETPDGAPSEGEAASVEETREASAESAEDTSTESDEPESETPDEEASEEDRFPVVVNGETHELTFEEMTARAQMGMDYEQKTQKLADERRAFDAQRTQVTQQVQTDLQRTTELANALEAALQANLPNWEELKENDYEEYLRERDRVEQQVRQIEAARQQQHQAYQQQLAATIPEERAKLEGMIPEWKDPETFNSEYPRLGRWLVEGGWTTAEDWAQVVDHRLVALAEYGRRYLETVTKAPAVKKKLSRLPKVSRPRASKGAADRAEARQVEAAKRFRDSGSVDDAVDVLLTR